MSVDEDSISREEQRILKSMAHARVVQPTRPRSWSLNSHSAPYSSLSQQIEKAESKPVAKPQSAHASPIHSAHHPIHPAHYQYLPDQAQHAQTQAQVQANGKLHVELPASDKHEEVRKSPTPEEEEEKRQQAERQAKMEQERFARYLGKASHTRSPSAGVLSPSFNGAHSPSFNSPSFNSPSFNSPSFRTEPSSPRYNALGTATAKPVASEKNTRQAVMLEISGHGSTKGEAGKQTSFYIKSKSVNLDANKSNVNVTVKITVKNAEGKVVELDNEVLFENDGYTVTYTPLLIGAHTIDVFVGGHLAHTMAVPVVEGGPVALHTEAAWSSLKNSSVGNKAQLAVTPMSFIKRLVPLGYSNLSAKVEHVGSNTPIKNVSVLGNKEGLYVVSFYPAQPGDHIISVTLNSQHISGSPFIFNVVG